MISFIIGFLFGIGIVFSMIKLVNYLNLKNLKNEYNSVFKEVRSIVGTKSMGFLSRFNSQVMFKANLKSIGEVNLILLLESKELSIFQGDKVIYTTHYADKNLIDTLIFNIENFYKQQIDNCYNIMGNIIDKGSIRKLNPNAQFQEAFPNPEKKSLDLDSILDRINEVGISNLTKEEKEFLKNQK
jgi:hypothetical protein